MKTISKILLAAACICVPGFSQIPLGGITGGASGLTLLCYFSQALSTNGGETSVGNECNATGATGIMVVVSGSTSPCSSLVDTSSNTYTPGVSVNNSAGGAVTATCYAFNPSVSTAMRWTYSAGGSYSGVSVWVWSGGTGALDQEYATGATASTSTSYPVCDPPGLSGACPSSTTFTTGHTNELCGTQIGFVANTSQTGTTINESFSSPTVVNFVNATNYGFTSAYINLTSVTTLGPTFTLANTTQASGVIWCVY